MLFPQV